MAKVRTTEPPVNGGLESKPKHKLKSKQRRTLQLLKSNPQRDQAPKLMADRQIDQAKSLLDSRKVLSRGQRKRLDKKQRFISQRLLEERSKKDEEAIASTKRNKQGKPSLKPK